MENIAEKRTSIVSRIVSETDNLCDCGFTPDHIDDVIGGFLCSDNLTAVIFQGRLYSTKTATASQLVFSVQQWVTDGAFVSILGLVLEVDPAYPVPITVTEGTPTESATSSSTTSAAIVGGTIAVVVFNVVFAIALVVGIILWAKCQKAKPHHPR